MKLSHQKLKLLYLMQILMEKTDDDHTVTVKEMIEELSKRGISAERKTIYDDLENLKLFGIDICSVKSKRNGYFVASRDFELPELKLLVDSVQSSKFITYKKSMDLIKKIEKLTSSENAKKLHRQVFVTNRVKALNEHIYYNVDKIHDAIAENKKITFKYFEITVDKKKVFRKNGENYLESPISLSWDDEKYYMISYKEKYDSFAHYRVDKMDMIEITDEERDVPKKEFDISSYAKSVFSMYSGNEEEISIMFENSLVGVVFDRFGMDIPIIKTDEEHFICNVKIAVSPMFLTWVMSFGKRAKIISPKSVIDKMNDIAVETIENYR